MKLTSHPVVSNAQWKSTYELHATMLLLFIVFVIGIFLKNILVDLHLQIYGALFEYVSIQYHIFLEKQPL